jgi:uncharacterized protein (TIGR00106 family)
VAIAEVSIVPVGTKTPSLSKHIARAVKSIQTESGLKYEVTAMGTIMEGDLDRILAAVKKMHEQIFTEDVQRVVTVVKIDDRRDKPSGITSKITSLNRELDRD